MDGVEIETNIDDDGGSEEMDIEFECDDVQREDEYDDYFDIGDPIWECEFCGALMWYAERVQKQFNPSLPKFSLCCGQGKIDLPKFLDPPTKLLDLFFNGDRKSRYFINHIRSFNMMFSFTSLGGKIDTTVNKQGGPPVFVMCGENYHQIGSLLPTTGSSPKFGQLYIFDTKNEVSNRMQVVRMDATLDSLQAEIVSDIKNILDQYNPYVKYYRMIRDRFQNESLPNIRLKLIGSRECDPRMFTLPENFEEVAALIVGDFDSGDGDRDIIVETQSRLLQRLSVRSPSYLPLQYPLLFPYGEDGYREDIVFRDEDYNASSSRLDAFSTIESSCLRYFRSHQRELRAELYRGLSDALLKGETDPSAIGKRIVLPSSFTGGPRYMIQNYQDAMTICKWIGYPDLFITFTCNQNWPEIARELAKNGQSPQDRPDLLCCVFKIKLDHLIKDIREGNFFGTVLAVVYTIEFQKRGLPHAHILVFLHPDDKIKTPEDIDKIICAEIPDESEDPILYHGISSFMIHGPCGAMNNNSPCMKNGKCARYYPKKFNNSTKFDEEGFPVYRRRNNGRIIKKGKLSIDNSFVVSYNRYLLLTYQAHINVEWCNQSRSIKYLFKYIHKGHDRITAGFYQNSSEGSQDRDEIKMYYDCRYLSTCEATWRLFAFDIHYRIPTVERLPFDLPDEQMVVYNEDDDIESIHQKMSMQKTKFIAWMEENSRYPQAKELTYSQFPTKFVWKKSTHEWCPRQQGFAIGRLHFVPPGSGEIYYLRLLLNVSEGPISYDDIRTYNGIVYSSFRETCYPRGLLDDDREYIDGIHEASQWGTAPFLRNLFATLLISNQLARPEVVWNNTWKYLSDDILHRQRSLLQREDLRLSEEELKNFALTEIESLLRSNNKSLADFPSMSFPNSTFISRVQNWLIYDELNYNRDRQVLEHNELFSALNIEQRGVYDKIMTAIANDDGGIFFLYGYGGTGKTFVWRTLTAALRSRGEIVLTVASSGIAALLLPGGRTAHSRFAIPINIHEDSTCNIKQGTPLAELIIKAKLIIWDEAPMTHKYCFEAVDGTLRDIMRFSNSDSLSQPFGGKIIIFGGDFRQILPVVPNGSREDVVFASISCSYLWELCEVLTLTQNMRLQSKDSDYDVDEVRGFSEWLLRIGDGTIGEPNDGEVDITIPEDLLITAGCDPIASIVDNIYSSIFENIGNDCYLQQRAILAPTNEVVEKVNEYMLNMVPGELRTYLSFDSSSIENGKTNGLDDIHAPEYLNAITTSGLPRHELKLKVGVPVMLLRNIDQCSGLCNGTRLIITQLGDHIIEAKVISGSNFGYKAYIPRLSLTPSDKRIPFQFQRRQFPLSLSFAMTINKSQGQSLQNVGLYLPRSVFSHGQLYVAISRVTNPKGLKILIHDNEGQSLRSTQNVVYREIFQNLF